jgi:hypothetical protein
MYLISNRVNGNVPLTRVFFAAHNKLMKTGRPPKPKSKRKTEFIKVLLTPAEKSAIIAAADGADLSAWARSILLAAIKQ